MDFAATPQQEALVASVKAACASFGDDYWLDRDTTGEFPHDFHRAMADCGVLGIAMPETYGGTGLGVTDAALVMHEVANTAGGQAAASAIHINIFGPHPIVVYGTEDQRQRWLPELIQGNVKSCFGVTEPDAGLDTTSIKTRAVRDGDNYVVHGKKIWTRSQPNTARAVACSSVRPISTRTCSQSGIWVPSPGPIVRIDYSVISTRSWRLPLSRSLFSRSISR